MKVINLWEDCNTKLNEDSTPCVILAGYNSAKKQQYIASYQKGKDWDFSVVPTITTKTRAEEILKRVQKDLPKIMEKRAWIKHLRNFNLEIKEVDKNFPGVWII